MNNPSLTLQPDASSPVTASAQEVADVIVRLFIEHGNSMYDGEQVSQLEHALQCAELAQSSGAATPLIVAALVHDIGHLLQNLPTHEAIEDTDNSHEELAAHWLSLRFGSNIAEPVRLHVAAKRFLCATDPVYFGRLSPRSQQSLKLQGGPMSTAEVGKFLAHPHYRHAVLVRRWDDEAKVVGRPTKSIEYYAAAIAQCVQ